MNVLALEQSTLAVKRSQVTILVSHSHSKKWSNSATFRRLLLEISLAEARVSEVTQIQVTISNAIVLQPLLRRRQSHQSHHLKNALLKKIRLNVSALENFSMEEVLTKIIRLQLSKIWSHSLTRSRKLMVALAATVLNWVMPHQDMRNSASVRENSSQQLRDVELRVKTADATELPTLANSRLMESHQLFLMTSSSQCLLTKT